MTTFSEIRGEVARLASAEDTLAAVEEYVDDFVKCPPIKLKIGEYALLLDPVKQGLEDFLAVAEPLDLTSGDNKLLALVEGIAVPLANFTNKRVEDSPGFLLARAIHGARGVKAPSRATKKRLSTTIFDGAISSVDSTNDAANAARQVILAANDPAMVDPHALAKAIANSTCLPLAVARNSFGFMFGHLIDDVRAIGGNYYTANRLSLRYDPDRRRVVLAEPIKQGDWPEAPVDDDRVGCPVSFSPGKLKAFYQYVVGQKAANDVWETVPSY